MAGAISIVVDVDDVDFGAIKTNDKANEDFRIYNEETSPARVVQHYKDMRMNHTVAFYRKMEDKYSFENGTYRRLMTIDEAFDELEHYVVCTDFDWLLIGWLTILIQSSRILTCQL